MQQCVEIELDGGALLCGRDASGTRRGIRSPRSQMRRSALNRRINATRDLAPSHRARCSDTCGDGRALPRAPALYQANSAPGVSGVSRGLIAAGAQARCDLMVDVNRRFVLKTNQ